MTVFQRRIDANLIGVALEFLKLIIAYTKAPAFIVIGVLMDPGSIITTFIPLDSNSILRVSDKPYNKSTIHISNHIKKVKKITLLQKTN